MTDRKMSQTEILKRVLTDANEWIPSHQLMMTNTKYGWLGSRSQARLNEMVHAKTVISRQPGKFAEFHIAEPVQVVPKPVAETSKQSALFNYNFRIE